jgi:hypothetical protein
VRPTNKKVDTKKFRINFRARKQLEHQEGNQPHHRQHAAMLLLLLLLLLLLPASFSSSYSSN